MKERVKHAMASSVTRDIKFLHSLHLRSFSVCASSIGSGETVPMRRLARTLAAR